MRNCIFLFLILVSSSLLAEDYRNWYVSDTLKTPETKELSKKEQRRALKAAKAMKGDNSSLSATKRRADDLYENLGFMEAADYYENLDEAEMNGFVQSKLANSYRLNGQYEEAEYWYSQMINSTNNPDDLMNYALVLQSNGKCEDAIRWYGEYLENTMDDKREFITDCDQLEVFKESKDVSVENMADLNSEALDFSPIQYKDGVVFTSNRGGNSGISVNRDKWTNSSFTDVFYAEKNSEGEIIKVEELSGDINSKYHDGVVTFNKAGTLMIFSRSNKKGRSEEGIKDLKLYSSESKDGYWSDPVELNVNDKEIASCHPTLSEDGRRLYFSSNRSGGYGGMDIWMSEKIGNEWKDPKNLGPSVNTSGQEVFPFINGEETLYYASNGHRGLGGLDIFAINKVDKYDEKTWSIRENLGAPFNTKKDDFGFTMNADGESGYFSSNRVGGKGGDDIYEWKGTLNEKIARNNHRKICVYDDNTGDRIEGIDVVIVQTAEQGIIESKSNDVALKLKPLNNDNKEYVITMVADDNEDIGNRAAYTTNSDGNFRYTVNADRNYIVLVENPKYENFRAKVSGKELFSTDEYCIDLTKKSCLILDGTVVNEVYNSRIPNAKIYLFNKCTGETTEEMSDENGEFNFCLECGCEYEAVGQKRNFEEGRSEITTIIPDCAENLASGTDIPLSTVVKMKVGSLVIGDNYGNNNYANGNPNSNSNPNPNLNPNGGGGNRPTYIFATPNMLNGNMPLPTGMTPDEINRYFTGTSNATYEAGQVIKLSNIYYDFDRSAIRKDAARELDHVYQLLRTYPSMHISMMSHTDSRGKNSYNQRLSHRRAEKAMWYLVSKGISKNRLTYEGLGESQHVNDCGDGVDCDEMLHQLNRRTEIKITQFNNPNVQIHE